MIQFSQWWGLLGLLSLPLLALLFYLRPKREKLLVSTNKIWREVLREQRTGFGLQKQLRNLSLLLLLLIALLLSLGLAGMSLTVDSTDRNDVVLVLDVSASMQARTLGGSTRFAEAKRQAAQIIDGLDDDARLLLMTSGRRAQIRTAFESEPAVLDAALEQVEFTDEAGQPRQALTLAHSLLRSREQGKIYFVTDGAFDGMEGMDMSAIEVRRVQGPNDNLAITGFDIRSEVGSEQRHQVLVTLRNYTPAAISTELTIAIDGHSELKQRLELGADQARSLVIPIEGRISGIARAAIAHQDGLAVDNQAFAVLDSGEPLRLLLISPGNFFLQSAFAALPRVTVTWLEAIPADFAEWAGRHDVIVIDRVQPLELPAGSYLLIDVVAPGLPFAAGDQNPLSDAQVNSTGPMEREIDLAGLRIDRARGFTLLRESPGIQRLIKSPETDLALALIQDDLRMVLLGFDLADSNFPLLASFPLFLEASLDMLQPQSGRQPGSQVAAGDTVIIQTPNGSPQLTVQLPSGDELHYESNADEFQFQATGETGFYRAVAGDMERLFAVNLTNEQESDIRPRASLRVEAQPNRSNPQVVGRVNKPFWPYLVLIALVMLLLEWGLWCWRGASA